MSTDSPFFEPDGEFISPSSIETFRLCKRKWAWGKIDKIEGPSNIAAEKGTHIHEVLEAWLKDGKIIDLDEVRTLSDGTTFKPGPIAAVGLKYLPMPKTCGTERFIHVATEKAKYHGYIDWDQKPLAGGIPVVGDHKSTSDFKWAKTEEDLRKDPQATIYAAAIMAESGASEVELRWVYYKTTGTPQARKVSLIVHRDHIEKNFDELDVTALEIIEARKTAKTALDLEPNVRACDNFGGCKFRANCNLSSTDRIKGLMAQESLAEKMEARKHGIEPNNEKEGTNMATLAEKMRERNAAAAAGGQTNGTAVAAAVVPPAASTPAPTGAAKMAGTSLGINPPEGSTTRAETAPEGAGEAAAAPPAARKNRLQRPAAGAAAPAEGAAPTTLAAPEAARAIAQVAAPMVVTSQLAQAGVNFILYIDCVPTKIRGLVMCVNSRTPEGAAAIKALEGVATDVVRAIG